MAFGSDNPLQLTQFTNPRLDFAQSADAAGTPDLQLTESEVTEFSNNVRQQITDNGGSIPLADVQGAEKFSQSYIGGIGDGDENLSVPELEEITSSVLDAIAEFGSDGQYSLPDPNMRVRC